MAETLYPTVPIEKAPRFELMRLLYVGGKLGACQNLRSVPEVFRKVAVRQPFRTSGQRKRDKTEFDLGSSRKGFRTLHENQSHERFRHGILYFVSITALRVRCFGAVRQQADSRSASQSASQTGCRTEMKNSPFTRTNSPFSRCGLTL